VELLNEELEGGISGRPCHRSQVLVDLVFGMVKVGSVAWAMYSLDANCCWYGSQGSVRDDKN